MINILKSRFNTGSAEEHRHKIIALEAELLTRASHSARPQAKSKRFAALVKGASALKSIVYLFL